MLDKQDGTREVTLNDLGPVESIVDPSTVGIVFIASLRCPLFGGFRGTRL